MIVDESSVFPARVGVFPVGMVIFISLSGLPRASGGVSRKEKHGNEHMKSSPREWGCFNSKGILGQQLGGLPRASGGVSYTAHLN